MEYCTVVQDAFWLQGSSRQRELKGRPPKGRQTWGETNPGITDGSFGDVGRTPRVARANDVPSWVCPLSVFSHKHSNNTQRSASRARRPHARSLQIHPPTTALFLFLFLQLGGQGDTWSRREPTFAGGRILLTQARSHGRRDPTRVTVAPWRRGSSSTLPIPLSKLTLSY